MKKLLFPFIIFIAVCAMGLFCALAVNIKWGTDACGLTALFTLLVASLFSIVAFVSNEEDR